MVVFEVVEDAGARPVVDELGALVEERGVVLVGLDDEERRFAEPRADAEVERHTADEEAGRKPCVLEDPREHAARRGLAVRARDREHPTLAQHLAREPLGPRCVRDAAFEQRLDHRHAARHDIADHHHIRRRVELRGVETGHDVDAERLELRAHRRIDVAVGPGDAMTGGARDGRDAAHEGAADAEDVQVHGAMDGQAGAAAAPGGGGTRPMKSAMAPMRNSPASTSKAQRNTGCSMASARMRDSTMSR